MGHSRSDRSWDDDSRRGRNRRHIQDCQARRDHAETISEQQFAHERLLAKEERDQHRLESTYVNLFLMAERAGQWAQLVLPMIDTRPPQPDRPLPSLEDQAK
ncbi:MAG: hypothetical protein J2P17_06565 [Mycobacterium sp.]|nr:hypothetical protein [Mycobacterium sp.]